MAFMSCKMKCSKSGQFKLEKASFAKELPGNALKI